MGQEWSVPDISWGTIGGEKIWISSEAEPFPPNWPFDWVIDWDLLHMCMSRWYHSFLVGAIAVHVGVVVVVVVVVVAGIVVVVVVLLVLVEVVLLVLVFSL